MPIKTSHSLGLRIVSAQDSTPPTGDSGRAEITAGRAVDCERTIGFYLYSTLDGSAATVVPYWWDEATQTWAADYEQEITMTQSGAQVNLIRSRGRWCQPRVTALTGTDIKMRYQYPIFQGISL